MQSRLSDVANKLKKGSKKRNIPICCFDASRPHGYDQSVVSVPGLPTVYIRRVSVSRLLQYKIFVSRKLYFLYLELLWSLEKKIISLSRTSSSIS